MNVLPAVVSNTPFDPADIRRYCDVVFGYLEGFAPIRMFSETGTADSKPKVVFHPAASVAEKLVQLVPIAAREMRGLYVIPGTVVAAGKAGDGDVVETGVLVIDIDASDIAGKRQHLEHNLGQPSLIVASGGVTKEGQQKLHLYWRLTEAARGPDLATIREMREAIAVKAGGDNAFASLHQPIRVAGSIHGKHGRQSPVRILTHHPAEYDLQELREAVATMPSIQKVGVETIPPMKVRAITARELAKRTIREGGLDDTTRYEALTSIIGHWLRNVRFGRCDMDEAWAAVRDHNAAMIVPPWDEKKLLREFEAIARLDAANHGTTVEKTPSVQSKSDHDGIVPPSLSEDAFAATFVDQCGENWRHVSVWNTWFNWSDNRWQRDDKGAIREAVRQICRIAAVSAERPNDQRRIASDRTIASVLRLVAADPSIATIPSDWDRIPMLLNTPANIIDLATGEALPHERRHLISQVTGARPGSGCPRWFKFLAEVTDNDQDLTGYLARLAGYCLTGRTTEQIFAFIHGPGGNGKSVFVQTIAAVLGDYAATATLDTFMASANARHLTELAGLRAARLVIVPETEAGRSWAEARIKTVTGGEKVRANFMHRDHFEYVPQFKLVVMGNHRPALSQVNEAMRRRMHLVPFDVIFPERQRDRGLQAALMGEIDGILGWMLEGCADWHRKGLAPPARMATEASDYFAAEDLIGQWMEAECHCHHGQRSTSRALFASWTAWATSEGHVAGSSRALGEALRARGFLSGKVGRARGWIGIGLRQGGTSKGAVE